MTWKRISPASPPGNKRPLRAVAFIAAAAALVAGLTVAAVGGASDGNFTAGLGTPTLDGLGAVGGGAHADDEHVLIAELPGRAALLAALIADVLASIAPSQPAGAAVANSARQP